MEASSQRRRTGRPKTVLREKPGEYVGLRAPNELKERLDAAAAAAGRSLSTEAQLRLEASFRDQRLFDEALDTECGEGTAGVVALLREIIKRVASDCLPFAGTPGATWMTHPVTYDQAVKAVNLALETLRPPGDPNRISAGDLIWSGGLDPRSWPRAGEIRAALMLHAVTDPDRAFAGLGPSAKPLAEKLGPELVDRIRGKDPDKIRRGIIKEVRRGGVEEGK